MRCGMERELLMMGTDAVATAASAVTRIIFANILKTLESTLELPSPNFLMRAGPEQVTVTPDPAPPAACSATRLYSLRATTSSDTALRFTSHTRRVLRGVVVAGA
jgi:hypothetical protein